MDRIRFETKDSLLFETVRDALSKDFEVVRSGGYIVVEDRDGSLVINENEVLEKPFSMASLARMLEGEAVFPFAGIVMYPAARKIRRGGKSAALTEMEADILELLCRSKRGLCPEDIMREVFGRASASAAKSLSTHIYNLRRKLSGIGVKGEPLALVKGRYKLSS
jgi:DNA-binding response OmpR family regulator